ncbi:transglutaminase [Flavobacterium sp. JRM]|nr:transglutaminase [Flavobacterium sp. JRM]
MKFNQLTIVLFIVLSFSKIAAQEFKLGKVSIPELQEKVHAKDTSASAAILFRKGTSYFEYDPVDGFVIITEVESRIKIYKKEGYDWANQGVSYYIGDSNSKESVSFSDAVTYNLVDGKIEKTKLKSDEVFDENFNKYYNKKKITMPNVKEGSVIEYKYRIKALTIGSMRDWYFQSSVPVNYSEFITRIPEYFVYNVKQKGYIFPKVNKETNTKYIVFNNKERSGGDVSTTSYSQNKREYQEEKTTYTAENLPAMKDEAYVNNINNYTSSLELELSMTKYPNQPIKLYSTDWNSVVKTIYNYESFGPELNKTGYFEDDLKVLLAGVDTQDERINKILNFVKTRVKWNGYTDYGCDNGVKKAYKEKTGNVADINLMLTAMLRHSGLTANPVLVSTRSNGIAISPNRTAFNYVIAAVETPNGIILLDASDKYSTPNILPFRALNWMGRLIRKDGTSEEIDLMPKIVSANNVSMSYNVDASGKVSGKTRKQYTNYNAMMFRDNIGDVKEDVYLEKLENDNNKIEVSDYSRTNEKELLLPVIETYSFSGNNLCEIIGDKIYIDPMLFLTDKKNPFTQENREYPVDYGFPSSDKYSINITIPDGFAVETLPASGGFAMENDLGLFKFISSVNGNILQVVITHQINEPVILPDDYSVLKEYYKGMIAKENEKIVLKRI